MGSEISSKLVIGVTMNNLFTRIEKKDNSYDEYDSRGRLTGRRIAEYKLICSLPNGNVICLANGKTLTTENWEYDFYSSMGLDGDTFINKNNKLKFHHSDSNYYNSDLNEKIVGLKITSAELNNQIKTIREVDLSEINKKSLECKELLKTFYGYVGEVKIYLIT